MAVFLQALFLIFAAEMGDKTQLLALAFAGRYPPRDVLAGVFLGTLANHALAVALGGVAVTFLPMMGVKIVAGASFIGFGLWTLRGDHLAGNETKEFKNHPVVTVAVSFFLAEMADKTQLATAALAAESGKLLLVWLGSCLAMVLADGLAIIIGSVFGRRLPERQIKIGAASLFVLFGILLLYGALR